MYRVSPTLRAICGVCAVFCVLLASSAVAQKPFSFVEAWRAHFFSRASYCDMRRVQSWTCGSACNSVATFEPTAAMNHIITGAGGFVGVDHATQQIVVAFRGTDNIQNILADINVLLAKYDKSSSCGSQCEVHSGFYASYMSLRQQTRDAVLGLIHKNPTYEIVVTGHSLGGAMALLAAADLQERLNNLESPSDLKPVSVYTFGAPRVGNAAFAKWADSLLAKGAKYRITHAGDPLVIVPARTWGYAHSTSEVFYKTRSNNSVVMCNDLPGQEDSKCTLARFFRVLDDHLYYMGDTTGCKGRASLPSAAVRDAPAVACVIILLGVLYSLL